MRARGYSLVEVVVVRWFKAALGQKCTNSNAGGVEGLDTGGGVASVSMPITVERKPAYYRVEIQDERASNPREKTKLSVLYAY
jgi:hypothetical protein